MELYGIKNSYKGKTLVSRKKMAFRGEEIFFLSMEGYDQIS